MSRMTLTILLVTAGLGLAACSSGGDDRVPLLRADKVYIVTGDDRNPGDIVVTGGGGASLTQADGPGADAAFAEFCRTQGHEGGTPGSYVTNGTTGYWHYKACSA